MEWNFRIPISIEWNFVEFSVLTFITQMVIVKGFLLFHKKNHIFDIFGVRCKMHQDNYHLGDK